MTETPAGTWPLSPGLEKEIRAMRAALTSDIRSRREHPSYGYTKTGIVQRTQRLHGMVMAWLIVTGRWEHPGSPMLDSSTNMHVMDHFGWSLIEAHREASAA